MADDDVKLTVVSGGQAVVCGKSIINPYYRHYCDGDCCVYLGPYKHNTIHGEVEHDLYYCPGKPGEVASYRARYGSEPMQEFVCPVGLPSMGEQHPALWQARRQARLRGLVK